MDISACMHAPSLIVHLHASTLSHVTSPHDVGPHSSTTARATPIDECVAHHPLRVGLMVRDGAQFVGSINNQQSRLPIHRSNRTLPHALAHFSRCVVDSNNQSTRVDHGSQDRVFRQCSHGTIVDTHWCNDCCVHAVRDAACDLVLSFAINSTASKQTLLSTFVLNYS